MASGCVEDVPRLACVDAKVLVMVRPLPILGAGTGANLRWTIPEFVEGAAIHAVVAISLRRLPVFGAGSCAYVCNGVPSCSLCALDVALVVLIIGFFPLRAPEAFP